MLAINNIAYTDYIHFLNQFDYIDLHNLCHTSTQFSDICYDDITLKSVLQNNIIEKLPNLNIAKPLQDLYDSINNLVEENYPENSDYTFKFPRWINIPQFKDDMIRRIYLELCSNIQHDIYLQYDEQKKNIYEMNKNVIHINKPILIFPFYALNIERYITDTNLDQNEFLNDFDNILKLSEETISYIEQMINLIFLEQGYHRYLESAIEHILFIKSYTRDAQNDQF